MKTLQRHFPVTMVGVALIGLAGNAVAADNKKLIVSAAAVKAVATKPRATSMSLQLPRELPTELTPDLVIESGKASYPNKPRLELSATVPDLPRAGLAHDDKHLAVEVPVAAESSLKIGLQSDLSVAWATRW